MANTYLAADSRREQRRLATAPACAAIHAGNKPRQLRIRLEVIGSRHRGQLRQLLAQGHLQCRAASCELMHSHVCSSRRMVTPSSPA